MCSVKLLVLRIKDLFFPLIICTFILFLIIYSKSNINAATNGLLLWGKNIFPSLFPFLIAVELLLNTNTISYFGKIFHRIMRPVFNVPGEGAFPLLIGIITGYPIAAKIIVNLKEQGICNKIECERLISFTNNSNPLFIIGTVGISMFHSFKLGILLLISHILSCFIVGFCFRFWKKKEENKLFQKTRQNNLNNTLSFSNLGYLLGKSIKSSINTIFLIGGFVVFFSVVCSILKTSGILNIFTLMLEPIFNFFGISYSYLYSMLIGIIELTNGLHLVSVLHVSNASIYIISFLLGISGLSIFLQIFSIISPANISAKPYILGKFLQAVFSTIIMSIML